LSQHGVGVRCANYLAMRFVHRDIYSVLGL
jgi:hypothetical protein